MKKGLLYGLAIISLFSCGNQSKETETELAKETSVDKYAELQTTAKNMFGTLPKEAINEENPITEDKVALGKMLYFDKRLSKDNTQSCNTCHNLDTYGVDNSPTSKGNNGGFGGRNSPTTLNAALHATQFWDGREPDVEAQAGGPILNPVEMEMPSEEAVVKRLSEIEEYVNLFAKAFPKENEAITYDNLKKAIGAFERELITPSKFDEFIAGDMDALTETEKEGLQTYINVGCAACHSGNVLGGQMFQKFGIFGNYWDYTQSEKIDEGKFEVTQKESDKYVFKVPSLRNIEKTYPYFHDGSVTDLKEAVKIMAKTESNKDLTDVELNNIVAFLKTLTADVKDEYKQH